MEGNRFYVSDFLAFIIGKYQHLATHPNPPTPWYYCVKSNKLEKNLRKNIGEFITGVKVGVSNPNSWSLYRVYSMKFINRSKNYGMHLSVKKNNDGMTILSGTVLGSRQIIGNKSDKVLPLR